MPKKKLPAIANSSVWEKVTTGRAAKTWDNAIDKVRKETGRTLLIEEILLSMEKFLGGTRRR